MNIKRPFWSPAGASAFILDWDGVIAETRLDFSPLREKYYGGRRAMLLEEAGTLEAGRREEFFRDLVELEMAGAESAEPVPGAFEMLKWLADNKIPYCILSRNCMEVIRRGAEKIGLTLPERTWGRDCMEWVKPDPRALRFAASQMGFQPRDCLYVGDFLYDLQGARRAGMRAVLVQRDEAAWRGWADAVYPRMEDFVAELRDPQPLVPWEYREICAKKGERWLSNAAGLTLAVPADPSPTTDCWVTRAAALGVGNFYVGAERALTPEEWKKNPSFDPALMGEPLAEVLRGFLETRYPLTRVVADATEAESGPKNSLDLQRFIERKRFV